MVIHIIYDFCKCIVKKRFIQIEHEFEFYLNGGNKLQSLLIDLMLCLYRIRITSLSTDSTFIKHKLKNDFVADSKILYFMWVVFTTLIQSYMIYHFITTMYSIPFNFHIMHKFEPNDKKCILIMPKWGRAIFWTKCETYFCTCQDRLWIQIRYYIYCKFLGYESFCLSTLMILILILWKIQLHQF